MPASHGQSERLEFHFISTYRNLLDVLKDHELAALGDAYVNFIFSLASSRRLGKPTGKKVDSRILANALRKANLRESLPPRVDRHKQADAAEALIMYAWIRGIITIEECIAVLEKESSPEEGFGTLLEMILRRVKF